MGVLVLIVDDDERNAKLARDVLEAAGFTTILAGTAADGVALARERQPDVIVMDLRLPDMDGAEAVRLLAADERTAHIPVLGSSALRAPDVEPWLVDAGFAGYAEKPIDVHALPLQVRALVAG